MSQPSVRVAVHRLSRASRRLIISGGCTTSNPCTPRKSQAWNDCGKQFARSHSFPSLGRRNVLSTSTILTQDGLDIQELPVLVRLLDKTMVPFSNHSFPGEFVRPMTAEDENFQNLLQQCATVRDVFKLLEIPSERVTGHSASAALQRMAELQRMNKEWDDLPSFISTAVINELYDTVSRDASKIPKETLSSLLSCYLEMENFSPSCASAVNGEIEKRMVEDKFDIAALCRLSTKLQASERGDKELVNSIWVYIGNHYKDTDEHNIALVLSSLPPSHKYLLRVLGKQLHRLWWKMKSAEVMSVLANLVKLNTLQINMMTDCARWLFLNVHDVTDEQLATIVGAYIHFQVSDASVMTSLERYIPAKGSKLDTTLLGLVQEYCRSRRYFSPTILDSAAEHFCHNGDSYSPLQVFTVLRPFGQLNYLPKDSSRFLLKTEEVLNERFSSFDPSHMAELLCSFAFVEKVPLNFVYKVLTPTFLSKVRGRANSVETGVWLEMLQSAVLLETRGTRIPCLYKLDAGAVWRGDKVHMLQARLGDTLSALFGVDMVRLRTFAPNTIHSIDAELHVTDQGVLVPPNGHTASQIRRVAILIVVSDHMCVNTGHMLGKFAMRRRHLRKMGYTVVEVLDSDFLPLSNADKLTYMREKLSKLVKISAVSNPRGKNVDQQI